MDVKKEVFGRTHIPPPIPPDMTEEDAEHSEGAFEDRLQYNADKVAVATQMFHYMIENRLEYSYITTGEADEVEKAIREAAPNKAPEPDEIPDRALIMALPTLKPLLTSLFNTCLNFGRHPISFKHTTTVALRKPGKGDYSQPGSYRPIALQLVEPSKPSSQSGSAGLLRLTTYCPVATWAHAKALQRNLCYKPWSKKYTLRGPRATCSLLFLDVSGPFDNVSHPRLLHNLRKRKIGGATLAWISSFLEDRSTELKLPYHRTKSFDVRTGIAQGSGASPILYTFYNGDLVELGNDRALDSIEVAYLAAGETVEVTAASR